MRAIKKGFVLFFIVWFMVNYKSRSQTVLLQVDRGADSVPDQRGPNLRKFSHGFLYFGFVAGPDKPGAKMIYGPSLEFGGGARKKYKISPLYSLGWEFGASAKIFKLKQEAEKILPDTILNKEERMEFGSVYISFYSRFNFDTHRGNYLGTFLDLGIRGEWDFTITHVIKNTLPDGSKIKSQITNLGYVNHFNYDVFARIGRSHVSLYASYRLSRLFKSSYHYPELPALRAGIELAIF